MSEFLAFSVFDFPSLEILDSGDLFLKPKSNFDCVSELLELLKG